MKSPYGTDDKEFLGQRRRVPGALMITVATSFTNSDWHLGNLSGV